MGAGIGSAPKLTRGEDVEIHRDNPAGQRNLDSGRAHSNSFSGRYKRQALDGPVAGPVPQKIIDAIAAGLAIIIWMGIILAILVGL